MCFIYFFNCLLPVFIPFLPNFPHF
jgi:hypothetical protein